MTACACELAATWEYAARNSQLQLSAGSSGTACFTSFPHWPVSYVVRKGDSLDLVAKGCGFGGEANRTLFTLEELQKWNVSQVSQGDKVGP